MEVRWLTAKARKHLMKTEQGLCWAGALESTWGDHMEYEEGRHKVDKMVLPWHSCFRVCGPPQALACL